MVATATRDVAHKRHNGKRYHVGTFATIAEAEAAAVAKRYELVYS
jgi:hypothetical protein